MELFRTFCTLNPNSKQIYNQILQPIHMKFLVFVAAALLQVSLSEDVVAQTSTGRQGAFTFKQQTKAKPTVPKSIANSKPVLAEKLSHLNPEQLQKFNELREAQKSFKASLQTEGQTRESQ